MKAYTFINSYICGIQVGIQAGHAITAYMAEHGDSPVTRKWLEDQTFVWLDGGDFDSMVDIVKMIDDHPHSRFYEPGLGGILTAVTVILDSQVVDSIRADILNDRSVLKEEPQDIFDIAARARTKSL